VSLERVLRLRFGVRGARRFELPVRHQKAGKRRIGSITPLLRIPSVPAFSLALAASGQRAPLLFSVANKPLAVCAWLVLGAAVPLNLYRLKSDKRNLDRRIVWCFIGRTPVFALLRCEEKRGRM